MSSTASVGQTWRYKAEYPDGRVVDGEVVATDEAAAARQVKALGATPVRVSKAAAAGQLFSKRRELNTREVNTLVRGLSDLLCAGVPLRTALESLAARERRPVLKAALQRLDQRVRTGEALSEALSVDPARPPALLIAMAEAGEASGDLGATLSELADRLEANQEVREDINGQMAYPIFVAGMAFVTLLGMAHFILPTFETLFSDQGAAPPPETAFVLQAGAFVRQWGHWSPVIVLGVILLIRTLARPFRFELERAALAIPIVGAAYMRLQAARYCLTLGQLLKAGYALARAEPVARGVLSSEVARQRLAGVAESVRAGGRFAEAVHRHQALPDDFLRLIELGEQTGALSDMLVRAATMAETEVARQVKRWSELLSPILIVALALCVMVIIISILIGVLSLNEVVYS